MEGIALIVPLVASVVVMFIAFWTIGYFLLAFETIIDFVWGVFYGR